MKVSTKGRYGLRVMVDLAKFDNGQYISLKDISQRQDISTKYLEQIMRILTKANLVRSQRGSAGGYQLMKNADQYTIKEIMDVCEGTLPLGYGVEEKSYMERCCTCATIQFWEAFYEHMDSFLKTHTLADIISKDVQIDYVI